MTQNSAPAKPADILENVIAVIDEMIDVMDREHDLILKRKMDEHAVLLKRKQKLTLDYRNSLRSIALQPEAFKALPDELRHRAKEAAARLSHASEKNARMLRGIMVATQRLVQTIVSMVKQEALPQNTYKNHTTAHLALGNYSPTCKPVTLNQTA
ncbi:MAG: hypothetical protein JO126_05105 [Alphaproteobacteria bacterium]|nr:hypothetical protein [Alphaproteobacteria bacterium]